MAEKKDVVRRGAKAAGLVVKSAEALANPTKLVGLAAEIIPMVWEALEARRKKSVEAWVQEVFFQEGDEASVAVEIKARIAEDEEAQEVLMEQVRRITAGVSTAAVPALAMLTRQVLRQRAKADSVFRGVSRVLSDVDSDEFQLLRQVIRRSVAKVAAPQVLICVSTVGAGAGAPAREVIEAMDYATSIGSVAGDNTILEAAPRETRRLFTLLDVNALATTKLDVGGTLGREPGGIIIERGIAARMADCMVR